METRGRHISNLRLDDAAVGLGLGSGRGESAGLGGWAGERTVLMNLGLGFLGWGFGWVREPHLAAGSD